jgi:hypothetical protein
MEEARQSSIVMPFYINLHLIMIGAFNIKINSDYDDCAN